MNKKLNEQESSYVRATGERQQSFGAPRVARGSTLIFYIPEGWQRGGLVGGTPRIRRYVRNPMGQADVTDNR